jgi:hypothetical protein
MRPAYLSVLLLPFLAACQTQASVKPVEFLDERTAMTVGSLKEPIELLPGSQPSTAARLMGKHISFAYLGPVEWDRSGNLRYGLWVHVAPGSGQQIADIHSAASVTLVLDDGPVVLNAIDAPQLGRAAYEPVASWGQTGYFDLDVALLQHMAASQKLSLDVRMADGASVTYFTSADTHAILSDFLKARAITHD